MSKSIAVFYSWPNKSGGGAALAGKVVKLRLVYRGDEAPGTGSGGINLADAVPPTYAFDAERHASLPIDEQGKLLKDAIESAQQGFGELQRLAPTLNPEDNINKQPAVVQMATAIADAINLAGDAFGPLTSDPLSLLEVDASSLVKTWMRDRNRKQN